tara:strand:+ start:394 stop:648 length:255 start_codon:yes stop_codon:yes gene_type:complete
MKELAGKINDFLGATASGLADSDIENAKSFLKHGEYGVAFELICEQLYENDALLTEEQISVAQEIAVMMELDDNSWSFLKENVQ